MKPDSAILDIDGLDRLIGVLIEHGHTVIGPTVRDSAIVLAELDSARDLPAGWGVDVSPGHYALYARDDPALFRNSAGPQSWKRFRHPPRRRLLTIDPDGSVEPEPPDTTKYAFLGVRGCDLAALGILDRVLGGTAPPPPFIIAVNCTEPGGVCFCASMGTGPGVTTGYDLALTERIDTTGHRFLVDVGSAAGAGILAEVPHRAATNPATNPETDPDINAEIRAARAEVAEAANHMGRAMPGADLRTLLRDSRESPHWEDVASRCLTCANCTMVCPTCFCTTTEDVNDLTGDHAERWQHWASCFELDFSYLHGGSVRSSGASRYRQWLSHKLSTWYDQFGSSGCVGCGRCIAWCPAGIDITAEVAALADGNGRQPAAGRKPDGTES